MNFRAYTNSVPDQHRFYTDKQHVLALYTKCVMFVGTMAHAPRFINAIEHQFLLNVKMDFI